MRSAAAAFAGKSFGALALVVGAVKSRLMKTKNKSALLLVLALLSSTVLAEWTEIQKFDDGMRIFVDKASARRSGDTARVTHLVRWGEPQLEPGSPPYLSTVVQTTYDCIGKRERYLASTSYAGPMGNGDVVISDEDEADKWYTISEGSMEERLWSIACQGE